MYRIARCVLDRVVPECAHGLAITEKGHRAHEAIGGNKHCKLWPIVSASHVGYHLSLLLTNAEPQTPGEPATETKS